MIDLFNKNFFRLALGFVAIIVVSMTVITLGHLLDDSKGGESVAETTTGIEGN